MRETKYTPSLPLANEAFISKAVVAELSQNGNLKVRTVLNVIGLSGRDFRGLFKSLKENCRSVKEILSQTSERLYLK